MRFPVAVFLAAAAFGQRFPMRYLGELGHLADRETLNLGGVRARSLGSGMVRLEGSDKQAKPWRIAMGATGGVGWTTAWSADFDADGQRDLLVGQHFPGNGACIHYARILVVLFDGKGRPVPWEVGTNLPRSENDRFPYVPVLAKDADRDGIAEFSLTECDPGKPPRVVAVHKASISGLFANYEATATERLKELRGEEFACARESCPPDSAILASGKRIDWPERLIVDGPEGREIFADGSSSWAPMFRLLRDGYPVRTGEWLWADAHRPPEPATVVGDLEVLGSRKLQALPAGGECREIEIVGRENWNEKRVHYCAASGVQRRSWSGTVEEFLPDRRTVRTSHTAMQHTVTGDTRFESPPGARALRATAELPSGALLTQWSGIGGATLLAANGPSGPLLGSRIHLPIAGDLIGAADGPVFLTGRGLIEIHGRLRWRRQ